jgi:enoyl-CoA hydratase/carnithine racemase
MPATTPDANGSTPPVVTIDGPRVTIRLNRPREHNRIEPDDLSLLRDAFARIDRDPAIRVLVLTGTGDKSFSSGYHIGALLDRMSSGQGAAHPHGEEPGSDAFESTVDALMMLRVPTICALNGSVYGGSTDLALACDFRIGVEGMRLVMPAARLGIVYYASGIERYVSRLGIAAAKKMFLTAQPIGTEELLRIGYLDAAAPADELEARVEAFAASLAGNAPLALAGLKRAINEAAAGRIDRAALKAVRARCAASADHAEALRAWSEKRKPVFRGR